MEISVKYNSDQTPSLTAYDLKIGEFASVDVKNEGKAFLLKTLNQVLIFYTNRDNMRIGWNPASDPSHGSSIFFNIKILPKGTEVLFKI